MELEKLQDSTKKNNIETVSALSNRLKLLVEDNFIGISVKGEIGACTIHSSGHIYFNIKDSDSSLDCVCWKSTAIGIDKSVLQVGQEVVLKGKVTTYPARSRYQIVVSHISSSGLGDLIKKLEENKRLLLQEGIFEAYHKHPLPFMPRKIGLVTSLTGAVLHDIINRITERCPINILVRPTKMQGTGAAIDVMAGINSLVSYKDLDLIIVARGGGSLEDLWEFNDPDLARLVAKCPIPLISAIGHETDTTLIDYAACKRAPTPSAAAEIAVPVKRDLFFTLQTYSLRLRKSLSNATATNQAILDSYLKLFKSLPDKVEFKQQILDDRFSVLQNKLKRSVDMGAVSLQGIELSFKNSIIRQLQRHETSLSNAFKLLNSYSHINILKRGFSIIKHKGQLIKSSKNLKIDDNIELQLCDGDRKAKVIA